MNFKLTKLNKFSGEQASIYSVEVDGENGTLFGQFAKENIASHTSELSNIVKRLSVIGKETGARHGFFKHNEGKLADGVCALYPMPNGKLRLYCIRYGSGLIVLGGGGYKEVRAYQDDETLNTAATLMIRISAYLTDKIKNNELRFNPDGLEFEGDLRFEID